MAAREMFRLLGIVDDFAKAAASIEAGLLSPLLKIQENKKPKTRNDDA